MSTESTQPAAQPAKKKGAHKPDCDCGWCQTRRANLAKKKPEPAQPATVQASQPEPEKKPSGESSNASSSPNSAPQDMAGKIAGMKLRGKKNEPANVPAKTPDAAAQIPAKSLGWFEKLTSGPSTFFED